MLIGCRSRNVDAWLIVLKETLICNPWPYDVHKNGLCIRTSLCVKLNSFRRSLLPSFILFHLAHFTLLLFPSSLMFPHCLFVTLFHISSSVPFTLPLHFQPGMEDLSHVFCWGVRGLIEEPQMSSRVGAGLGLFFMLPYGIVALCRLTLR